MDLDTYIRIIIEHIHKGLMVNDHKIMMPSEIEIEVNIDENHQVNENEPKAAKIKIRIPIVNKELPNQ